MGRMKDIHTMIEERASNPREDNLMRELMMLCLQNGSFRFITAMCKVLEILRETVEQREKVFDR